MIRISNCEDRDAPANLDRTITISGNCESVALAQYLINMRSVMWKILSALSSSLSFTLFYRRTFSFSAHSLISVAFSTQFISECL